LRSKGSSARAATDLAQTIGQDGINQCFKQYDAALAKSGSWQAMYTAPYLLIAYMITQLARFCACASLPSYLAYGAVAGAIIGILGPDLHSFLVIEIAEFLCWGWSKPS